MKKIITILIIFILCSSCHNNNVKDSDYDKTLFDDSYVHEVDVLISEEDYEDLLKNPADKTKYTVDVMIDGEKYEEVSFSTKGNSSLMFVAADENSDRYSYKINFSKNRKDQTCHGLDKLNLNNMFHDPSYIRDYLSYEMFRDLDIDSPLIAYCLIKINGIEHGLYAMVEDVDNSFLIRNRNGEGQLYKPEADLALNVEDIAKIEEDGLDFDVDVNGADFIYSDDDPSSYSDIFDNNVTKAEEADHLRVISALKGLNEGKDLEKYLYTDELIRYFAAQSFLLNYDGYIGPMLHNHFLYENDGRIALFPWDYNLAFLNFSAVIKDDIEDLTPFINCGIDTPLILADEKDRPLWKWIQDDDEYRKQYHESLSELLKTCVDSGAFEQRIDNMHQLLRPYVINDPSAFYNVEQFDETCESLKLYAQIRSDSIHRQLDGKLSTYSDKQKKEDMVDASMLRFFR